MVAKRILRIIQKSLDKTHSIRFRFLATVVFAMLAITVFIGGLSIYEVDNYIQEQTKKFVNVTCESEGAQINDSFGDMEKSVEIMESYVMGFFENKDDIKNPKVQEKVIKSADEMFVDVAKHTSGAVTYYFRFNPEISNSKSGLFYSKLDGSDEYTSLEPTDLSLYEKDDMEHVGWFWLPYEAGEPIWMAPYYNQNNNILMISYVVPMYYEDQFVGVVGMDFDYVILTERVHEIQIYENGFAHLEVDGVVICNDDHKSETKTSEASDEYLRVSKKLVNGMSLVLSASYDDIRQIRYEIAFKILFVVSIISSLFLIVVILIANKIVDPLKKITDASVKLSNGEYDVKIVHSNMNEIKLLSTAFESMRQHLQEREKHLHLSANRDSLTGLRNTNSYDEWVSRFNKGISKGNIEFGVLVFDINYLKETNDEFGHKVGNELIILVAKVISDTFKRSPVFRIGGDEFVAVLQNRDMEEYEELLMRFDSTCANSFIEKEVVQIPISVAKGIAWFDSKKDSNFVDVFKRADDAMYENKRKMKTEKSKMS